MSDNDLMKISQENLASLNEAIVWQARFRRAVDEIVAGKIHPLFKQELLSRWNEDQMSPREICRWANATLNSVGLCAATEDDIPASFHAKKSRSTDPGRIYLEPYSTRESPRNRATRVTDPAEVRLRPLPEHVPKRPISRSL